MTDLQMKLLEYWRQYHKEHKTHPSLTAAAKYFKKTRQTITQRVDSLVNKGYLRKVYDGAYIPTNKK